MMHHREENDGSDPFPIAQTDADRVAEPELHEQMDTSALPSQSKIPPPDVQHARVTHYAYDPQTYEILCRPGQQLTQKKARRLQELELYAHVVTHAD